MEEQTSLESSTTEPVQQTPEPAKAETPPAAPAPDWRKLLDDVPIEELRAHPRYRGAVGSEIDTYTRRRQAEMDADARRKAQEEQDSEFARLASENDEVLARDYPKVREALQERLRQRDEENFQRRVGESMGAFANRIGQAYARIPEWAELTNDDRAKLQAAIDAEPTEEAKVSAFTVTAAELVAEKKAEKRYQSRLAADYETIKKTIRQELAADQMTGSAAPDLKKPGKGLSPVAAIAAMSDAEIDALWKKTYG